MTHLDKQIFRAIGLMSGTSMDGVDAALVETDGHTYVRAGPHVTLPYTPGFRGRLRAVLGTTGESAMARDVAVELTATHADAVNSLRQRHPGDIDLIGFHGHTIHHDPARRYTRQIGDGPALARAAGVRVVDQFRIADVAAGGQGAPLVPLYHQALAAELPKPLAILNIGGVANVTYLGSGDPIAFDTGPGNALLDDLFLKRTGKPLDQDGAAAARGQVNHAALAQLMDHPYFTAPIPKSLDRNAFSSAAIDGLTLEDAAATLVAFTVGAVAAARDKLPAAPQRWLVAGGGRHNAAIMRALRQVLEVPVDSVESVGWDGDALEAQAFAYLAVRSIKGLPLSLPTTTGVEQPMTGGTLHLP
jgi:anhydro-N-acetylmuramic acid kinase